MYGHGGGIGGMGGLGSYGDSGFGDVQTDWRNWIRSAYRGTTPGLNVARTILDHAATTPPDLEAWIVRLPRMSCADMARSIGLSFDTTAICEAFNDALGTTDGWNVVSQTIADDLAAEEAKRWESATCADRAVADGGGSVCTASDGAQQVRCYNSATGVMDTYAAGTPCPPGTGGVSPRPVAKLAATPKVLQPLRPVVSPETSKPVVSGYVVGVDGVGIAGANVQLRQPVVAPGTMVLATSEPSTTTDSSGGFMLEPKPSTYELVVSAPGFNEAVYGPITVPATGTVDVGALALEATAVLPPPPVECPEGKVLDPVTGGCVAAPAPSKPWYKSTWLWVAVGGVVVVGGGYLLLRSGKKKEGA